MAKVATPTSSKTELQQFLPSVPVPELAEDDAAERTGGETDRVGHKGGQDCVELVPAAREEDFAEDQRGRGAIKEELIPFHDRAGHGRGDHSAKIRFAAG